MVNNNIYSQLVTTLNEFHNSKGIDILAFQSPLAGDQFPGEFNVSGFHKKVLNLAEEVDNFWGIDTCLRVQDIPDSFHSFLFHMGIYAQGIDLAGDYRDPFNDKRFVMLQEEVIDQFIDLLAKLNIKTSNLEATYWGGGTIGGLGLSGQDKLLTKSYSFPKDMVSESALKRAGMVIYPVSSLLNIDIQPCEGALVGFRIEVGYGSMEIATIVFDCFKVNNGHLVPINYVAGYALGIERLQMIIAGAGDLLKLESRYSKWLTRIRSKTGLVDCKLLASPVRTLVFGLEALESIKKEKRLSTKQKERVRILRKKVLASAMELGLHENIDSWN